jgi:bifunctional non-homologous end joining protein LigD
MARTDPEALSAKPASRARSRQVLVDYRGNDRGASSIAAFSVSVRAAGSVSTPVAWADLQPARPPDASTIADVVKVFTKRRSDPWAAYWKSRQKLTKERLTALARYKG